MFVYFEKAFDSIEWAFLFRTLAKFNLGCDFQQWVKLLYTSPFASVKNNGYSSSEFCLSRGVRQGCQVSALIFIMCMEIMANHIWQNVNIRGLSLDEHGVNNIKIIRYADDPTLFVKNSFEIKEAISSLEQFGKIAGTKLNIGKYEGLWIGSSKNRQNTCTLYNIKWTKEPIRYLGIYSGYDSQKCFKLNFENRIKQVDEVLTQSAKRNLTLFGNVCIIKSLALANIFYVSMYLVVPELVIKQIGHRIFRHLWGKRDRIKRKSITNKLEDGGLNMVDFKSQISAMKAAWEARIVTAPNNHLWAFLPKLYLSKYGEDFLILKTTATDKAMISCVKSLSEFYQDVIISYNKSKVINYEDFCNNVLNQPIWGNKFIKFRNKTLFIKNWIAEGIVSVKNLKIRNGVLDIAYLNDIVKDKRNFHIEINMLNAATNMIISNEPVQDTTIPIYIHNSDDMYNWTYRRSKYYYDHIIGNVVMRPTSERYWENILGLRVSDTFFHKSYVCKVKQLKDKKLTENKL